MNRIIPAAVAAVLAFGGTAAIAQEQPLTEPPAGGQAVPQTGPGQVNETGNVELPAEMNDDTSNRVLPEVGSEQAAEALEEQTGVPQEVEPGGIVQPVN